MDSIHDETTPQVASEIGITNLAPLNRVPFAPKRRWSFSLRTLFVVMTVILLASWFVHRAVTLGLNNVFSSEYAFQDSRPLTETVALEVTRKTLEIDGRDPSQLMPVEYWHDYPEGHRERLFARNTLDPDSGRVLWAPKDGSILKYSVNVHKRSDMLYCRVYLPK